MQSVHSLVKQSAKAIVYFEPFRRLVRHERVSSALIRAIQRVDPERPNTGGTDNAQYCYGAWLRHWKGANLLAAPSAVLEVGPGDSLGVGLSAMLSGANTLFAVDAQKYADAESTLRVLEDLVSLFRKRAPIPSNTQFPEMRPFVEDYSFPENCSPALDEARIADIRAAIRDGFTGNTHGTCRIRYVAPWDASSDIPESSVDLIYSQATMEHVSDIDHAYRSMSGWLRPTGMLAHQIDFRCHSTSLDWNGHWLYGEREWARVQNHQTYYWINRLPCSSHLEKIEECGCKVIGVTKLRRTDGIPRDRLAEPWRSMSVDDSECEGVYVVARKTGAPSKAVGHDENQRFA